MNKASDTQRAEALKALAYIMAWMTTLSYLTKNSESKRFNVAMHIAEEIEDFEFQDPIMQNRFRMDAEKAIEEDGVFVSIESLDEEGFGAVDAVTLAEFTSMVNTIAIIASDRESLAAYGQIIAPAANILVMATKYEMDTPFNKRAFTTAHTTALEINSQIQNLKDSK